MKITAILGSPRAGGNTDTLSLRVLDGAKDVGLDTEAIALRNLKIKPCTGCEQCWHNNKPCVSDDDMTTLYDAIAGSDILLFATPLYWYAPTTIMKAFMDRLVPLCRPQGLPMIENKGVILVTAYEEEGPEAAEPLLRMYELSFKYLKLEWIDRLVVDGVGPKGAVLQKADMLDRAYEIGKRLADWSRK